jgi:deferrochelatase/peroxidase EfeB
VPEESTRRGISRGELFKIAGATGAGIVLGGVGTRAVASTARGDAGSVPFFGIHQAGIDTPLQQNMLFAAFDLTTDDVSKVRKLLREWTAAAVLMCEGREVGETDVNAYLPPEDTGEALGMGSSRLTLTFGFGSTLFEQEGGEDRFGLRASKPEALVDIPPMPGEEMEPERSGGDLCVQACAEDKQVAFHAIRNLTRISRGIATIRWSQVGFGPRYQKRLLLTKETPRNLFGFKDGTNNLNIEDEEKMARHVWVDSADDQAWMGGGTYVVARRIRMLVEVWDRSSLRDQEQSIGRVKISGAPIGSENEFDPVDLAAKGDDGRPLAPPDSHVRLSQEGGEKILRRGYSFTDGVDLTRGQLEAGLFFVCFQRDPQKQFVPLQRRLAQNDALNEYILHTGSAVFACPPGAREGGYVGETLFDRA